MIASALLPSCNGAEPPEMFTLNRCASDNFAAMLQNGSVMMPGVVSPHRAPATARGHGRARARSFRIVQGSRARLYPAKKRVVAQLAHRMGRDPKNVYCFLNRVHARTSLQIRRLKPSSYSKSSLSAGPIGCQADIMHPSVVLFWLHRAMVPTKQPSPSLLLSRIHKKLSLSLEELV